MNTLVGIILGCLLTVGVVYVHDTMAASPANGEANARAIVNWDVAATEWHHVTNGVRTAWIRLNNDFNRG